MKHSIEKIDPRKFGVDLEDGANDWGIDSDVFLSGKHALHVYNPDRVDIDTLVKYATLTNNTAKKYHKRPFEGLVVKVNKITKIGLVEQDDSACNGRPISVSPLVKGPQILDLIMESRDGEVTNFWHNFLLRLGDQMNQEMSTTLIKLAGLNTILEQSELVTVTDLCTNVSHLRTESAPRNRQSFLTRFW